jgi:plasmid stability protein
MTSITIELPDDQAVALKMRAAEEGLSLEGWASRQLADSVQSSAQSRRSPQEAAARILELQKDVKPDPDGWTVKDYINFGRP